MGDRTLPFGFLGFIFLLAIFYFIHPSLILFAVPLMGAVGLIYFYRFVSLIFDKRIGILAMGLLFIFPAYFHWSNLTYYNDIPAFAFFTIGIFYFFKALHEPDKKLYYLLASIFLSIAIWVKYPIALLLFSLLPGVFIYRKRLNLRYLVYAGIMFSLCMLPLFILNAVLYGGPFITGVGAAVSPASSGFNPSQLFLFPFKSFDLYYKTIDLYIIQMNPLIFVLSLTGLLFVLMQQSKSALQKSFTSMSILLVLILVSYYGGGGFYGQQFKSVAIGSSYARYLIPLYAVLIVFASAILVKMPRFRQILPIILAIYVLLSVNVILFSHVNLWSVGANITKNLELLAKVQQQVPADGVIFSTYWDKIIFPHRSIALYRSIPEDIRVAEATNIARTLVDDGVPTYFLNEDRLHEGLRARIYFAAFENAGLKVTLVDKYLGLYRLESK